MKYERHCVWDTECLSHCIKNALSSDVDIDLREVCNNEHLIICKDCFNLLESINLLKNEVEKVFDPYERESLLYEVENSFSKIHTWQQHIIRGAQQNKAKSDALKDLHNSQALWIRDWAQKVLPGSGLEAQSVSIIQMCHTIKQVNVTYLQRL